MFSRRINDSSNKAVYGLDSRLSCKNIYLRDIEMFGIYFPTSKVFFLIIVANTVHLVKKISNKGRKTHYKILRTQYIVQYCIVCRLS